MRGLRIAPRAESGDVVAAPPIWLTMPLVAYEPLDEDDEESGAADGLPSAGWRRDGQPRWRWDDGRCAFTVESCGGSAGPTLQLAVEALHPVRLRHAAVELECACDERPLVLGRELRWCPLEHELHLSGLTPLTVRIRHEGSAYELRAARIAVAARLSWTSGLLRLAVYLDAASLHPKWSFAGKRTTCTSAPARAAGWRLDAGLRVRRLDDASARPPVVASRLPAGAEAALVVTDHSDFDTTERLRAFLDGEGGRDGWVDRGLRMTKGVFTLPSVPPAPRVPAPSLEVPEYHRLVRRLHEDGSEIAPHGVNESRNVPPDVFRAALSTMAREFAPRTWIDHGMTLNYCYTMGGAENEYDLLGELRRNGITTLWSYNDVPALPAGSLNMLVPTRRPLLSAAHLTFKHAGSGSPLVAAHYVRSFLRTRLDGAIGQAVMGAMSNARHAYMAHALRHEKAMLLPTAAAVLAAARPQRGGGVAGSARKPYDRADELEMVGIVYPERSVPLASVGRDDPLLFSTMEIVHTRDAFTPRTIKELVHARGLHLAHCYLLNRLPYIAGVFAGTDAGDRKPGAAWGCFVRALETEVRAGTVWNPPVGELAEWFRSWQAVELDVVRDGAVELRDAFGVGVRDFTLLLPGDVQVADVRWGEGRPCGHRRWDEWLAVWGDVPAREPILVRWA